MKRNTFQSVKGCRESGFINQNVLFTKRVKLEQSMCKLNISCILIIDEVGLLSRTVRRHAIRDSEQLWAYDLIKDRLTAVLTAHIDGWKGTLTVIETAAHPRSFPRHLDPAKDLTLFHKLQSNAGNTQLLWSQVIRILNKRRRLQNRKCANIFDNCSAHTINYDSFEFIEPVFLRPRTTSALPPIDAFVGRPLKCAFRRLLVEYILEFVERSMAWRAEQHKPLKINETVTTYHAVELMKRARDLVPISVVLNEWLRTDILTPHQRCTNNSTLNECGRNVKAAEKAFEQTCFGSERITRKHWLKGLERKASSGSMIWSLMSLTTLYPTWLQKPFESENIRAICDIQASWLLWINQHA